MVTADADGQHHPDDVVRVGERLAREPGSMVLGARGFEGDVPARSRVGNRLSRLVFRMLMGQKLGDTQTGLRGIPPRLLAELARMKSRGYEFEIDMLTAAKHLSVPIVEEPIRTIYEPGNPTSHFNPLRDSMRIGFVLARFTMLSLATAVLDNMVFSLAIGAGSRRRSGADRRARNRGVRELSAGAARGVSVEGAAPLHAAPLSRAGGGQRIRVLPVVEACSERCWGWTVLEAKIAAESALFIVNFMIQRDWVFVRRQPSEQPIGTITTGHPPPPRI